MNATILLVGNYNITERNAYKGLQHGRLNRVFELAGMLCQPHPQSPLSTSERMLFRCRLRCRLHRKLIKNGGAWMGHRIQGIRPPPRNWRWLRL
jgi:hypothetical protein